MQDSGMNMTPFTYPSSILCAKTLNFTATFRQLNIFLNSAKKKECFSKTTLPNTAT